MKILVFSDIHANVTALDAVLADAGNYDEAWCLGDVIGYGPDPNDVVDRLLNLKNLTCLLGNHDAAITGLMPMVAFNNEARKALEWQKEIATPETLRFLDELPHEVVIKENVSIVHGSPRDPIWEYVINTLIARLNFDVFTTPYCFVGHSHVQCLFNLDIEKNRVSLDMPAVGKAMTLTPRAILNPGSVGQPRDRDPRAAYAFYDTTAGTWTPRRVVYDVGAVQKRIRAADLPEKLALRLAEGW